MIETEGLTHIHLVVKNIDRSVGFYQRVFGMKVKFTEGQQMVFLSTPGQRDTITLNQSEKLADHAGTSGGVEHFGFRLKDPHQLDAAIEEVTRAGGKLIRRGEHAPGYRFAYVADPDGYIIEL